MTAALNEGHAKALAFAPLDMAEAFEMIRQDDKLEVVWDADRGSDLQAAPVNEILRTVQVITPPPASPMVRPSGRGYGSDAFLVHLRNRHAETVA